MSTGLYDLKNIAVSFLGTIISNGGAGSGGFCKIEKEDPTWKHTKGVGGDVARYRVGSEMYKITITVLQTSKLNAILTTIQQADAIATNGSGVGPLLITDLGGTSTFAAGSSWLEGPPTTREYSNEVKDNEWVIMANADLNVVAGN